MQFFTWVFALFFLIFYAVYVPLQRTRFRLPWLLLASYVFYGCFNLLYPLLILYATVVDYLLVMAMAATRWKRPWLLLSVVNNLSLLGYYKYSAFIAENVNWVLAKVGLSYVCPVPKLLLPVGISFFVFRSLTYTIDFYRSKIEKEPNFLRYAAFVAFFPELLAGPIDRARDLLPQFRHAPTISRQDVADGLSLFVVGLFKKLALADYLGMYVVKVYGERGVFGKPGEFQTLDLLLATFVFAWQIYFDFSGYSDMARGIGRLLGFQLTLNFNNPYLATGLGDFWRRWHISLSNCFKDYVYIPLGGNRHGEIRTYVNMCVTMVISGLWHGSTWNFVIWGAVHALGRGYTRFLELSPFYQNRVPTLAKQLLTFILVSFAWIFFNAHSFSDAMLVLRGIFAFRWSTPCCPLPMLVLIFAVWIYQFAHESRLRWFLQFAPVRIGLVVLMVAYLALFAGSSSPPFIYEQF